MYGARQGLTPLMLLLMLLLAAMLATQLLSCAVPDGRPPVARISALPKAIPEHDDFQTDVILDATTSTDPIDDPDGARPLRYEWQFSNDEVRVQSGSMTSDTITVRFLGNRPPTVRLTATDEDGLSSTATMQLQLTIP